jgi:nicotinate-nucleotide adenylyltransferase
MSWCLVGSEMCIRDRTYGANINYLEAPMLELSATLIRNNRKAGITIRYLVPDKVKEEIENNNYFKD